MELREIDWRSCVIDEAHRLKNAKCQLLECLNLLSIESRCLLSGTPLQNNINELYSLLSFLEPTQFTSQESFMLEFGDMQNEDQVNKLQAILKPLMLRRMKEDVEKSLKPKTETIVEVELTNIQKKYYRAILERNFAFLNKGKSENKFIDLGYFSESFLFILCLSECCAFVMVNETSIETTNLNFHDFYLITN